MSTTVRVGLEVPDEWSAELLFAVTDYAITMKTESIRTLIDVVYDLPDVTSEDLATVVTVAAGIAVGRCGVEMFGGSIDELPDGCRVTAGFQIVAGEGA
jgi:hypothetical protein